MYDNESDTSVLAQTSNLNEKLGQVTTEGLLLICHTLWTSC
jgi:hypothetical protein